MVADTIDIQVGVTVRDVHGEEVGEVAQIWPYVPADCADGPLIHGPSPADRADMGYFCMDRGGIAGIGAKHFYLPFNAVDEVEPDGSIRLNCAAQECEEMYGRNPWFADRDID